MKKIITKQQLHDSGKKSLALIPFFFTFSNALFGFLSVVQTLDEQYSAAAWCIVAAGFMDMIDGRLARFFGSSSYFGKELDSLCDAVSFCFAPAILIYSWSLYAWGVPGIIVLGIFLCSGLFRLARFNLLQTSHTHYFTGLPTTIAAFFLAQIVLHENWIAYSILQSALRPERMAFIVCVIALLMISSIKFPALKSVPMNVTISICLFFLILLAGWALLKGYPLLLFLVSMYIVGGFAWDIFKEIARPLWR